jgi:tetratricopeptide (TPR) repeat protein
MQSKQFFGFILMAFTAAAAMMLGGCESALQKNRDLGVKLYDANQFDQSLATLNKALSYNQFDAVSNTYAGLIHYRAGDYEQASYYFKVALESDPSSEQAKDGLTETLIRLGKPDLALDALERAAAAAEKVDDPRWKRSNPKRPYTSQIQENLYVDKVDDRLRIARTYEKLGDYDNAVLYYKKALQMTPRNSQAMLGLANLYEKLGNKKENREYLIQAYNVDPATPGLTQAMTRNGVMISDVLGVPPKRAPLVPAPAPAPR